MKNKSALAAMLLSTTSCVLRENNVNLISSLKYIVTNMTSFAFVISVFATKNVINAYKKNIILSTKNIQVKNLAKNVTKYRQNILHYVKTIK